MQVAPTSSNSPNTTTTEVTPSGTRKTVATQAKAPFSSFAAAAAQVLPTRGHRRWRAKDRLRRAHTSGAGG